MLCVYGHIKYFTLSLWRSTLDVRILTSEYDVNRRQILTSENGPLTERVKDVWHEMIKIADISCIELCDPLSGYYKILYQFLIAFSLSVKLKNN